MQYKTDGWLIRPFILLFLSQNFLYKTNMKFYAVWQSRMVEMHIRIMKTRLCIFTQSDESCFQFRLFLGYHKKSSPPAVVIGGIKACGPSSSLITSAMMSVTSGVMMEAGAW